MKLKKKWLKKHKKIPESIKVNSPYSWFLSWNEDNLIENRHDKELMGNNDMVMGTFSLI